MPTLLQSMDETENYQQRLQAIAERRRHQEEEEKLRRETDEEWLKTAQKKRKSLRDQWLSETAPAPVLPSLVSFRPCPPMQDEADEYTALEQTRSQKMPEYEEDEAADASKYKEAFQEENKKSVKYTAAARTYNNQAGADEDVQVDKEAEDHFSMSMTHSIFHERGKDARSVDKEAEDHFSMPMPHSIFHESGLDGRSVDKETDVHFSMPMTHSIFHESGKDARSVHNEAEDHFSMPMPHSIYHESGQDGRSVLGMLAVQVERDPKTGATVVRSVAPVSTPADAPVAATVFDDGRMSIHTVGGSGVQPSTEELGQILSVIDGVGMKVLLDEVPVMPNKAETNIEDIEPDRAPEGKVLSFSTRHDMSEESSTQLDSSGSHDSEAEMGIEGCAVSVGEEVQKVDGHMIDVTDMVGKVDSIEDNTLEEGPVTLVFMGYTDDTTGESVCLGQDDHEGMLTVERVMITEDGEEHVIGPQATLDNVAEQEAKKEPKEEAFQDVPLDGNGAGVKVLGDKGDNGLHNSSPPSIAEGEITSKRKTCQCCSVM
ncbi:paralemmin-1-like isoform X10 [Scomber scombrus]|uniref:paralemmin-1-like isoform X10 n=1 Tax=Scomber scombrus TaxID=13677 RepID=UPI002DD91A0A|nr:paralemmin-1-like isoform X10 [Scomber scombrus]